MENQRSRVFVPKKPVKKLTLKKNTVTITVDNKVKNEENEVKNTMELEEFDLLCGLPYEIFLKIMEYLSTSDILKRMAPVSKRFYQLSQDKTIIKRIEFMTIVGLRWSDERKEKYYNDFFKVLKNSQKLKFLTIDLDQQPVGNFYRDWIEASVNLQCLEEFYIKIRNFELDSCTDFLQYGVLDQCPKLKILKIRRHRILDRREDWANDPFINFDILNTIASFNSKSLQKVHLYSPNIGTVYLTCCPCQKMKTFLEMITETLIADRFEFLFGGF